MVAMQLFIPSVFILSLEQGCWEEGMGGGCRPETREETSVPGILFSGVWNRPSPEQPWPRWHLL